MLHDPAARLTKRPAASFYCFSWTTWFIGRIFAGRCRLSLPKLARSWRSGKSDWWFGGLDAKCCIREVAVSQRLSGGLSVS